jgi:hypothetical protein
VHAVGYKKNGDTGMLVWQVRGGSESGERVGWKLFTLNETFSVHAIDEGSNAPRTGYNPEDTGLKRIICQIRNRNSF